ncbi:MAG: hypothetical protein IKW68_05300, partial [Clostridia bacterium]|nr:hypothetical protein [Clostridia bacterium]
MKKIRILAALLALSMTVASLAACAVSEDDPADTKDPSNTLTETEGETELQDWLPDDLNYNDDEVTILSRYREGWTAG